RDARLLLEATRGGGVGGSQDEAGPAQVTAQRRQRGVRGDRQRKGEPELPAVLGRVRDARAEGVLRVPDRHRLVSYPHLAHVRGRDTEEREANVRTARSDETGKAQDLAGAHGEGD